MQCCRADHGMIRFGEGERSVGRKVRSFEKASSRARLHGHPSGCPPIGDPLGRMRVGGCVCARALDCSKADAAQHVALGSVATSAFRPAFRSALSDDIKRNSVFALRARDSRSGPHQARRALPAMLQDHAHPQSHCAVPVTRGIPGIHLNERFDCLSYVHRMTAHRCASARQAVRRGLVVDADAPSGVSA